MRRLTLICAAALTLGAVPRADAQLQAGYDTVTRWSRVERNVAYGAAMATLYSAYDQLRDDPSEWERTWDGYGKRYASNFGEFIIQEGVTDGLSVLMHRPQGYRKCNCGTNTGKRIGYAWKNVVTDQMPNGSHPIAWPRLIGTFAGSTAQAAWRPNHGSRYNIAITNGVTSLAIGGLINMWYEFRK